MQTRSATCFFFLVQPFSPCDRQNATVIRQSHRLTALEHRPSDSHAWDAGCPTTVGRPSDSYTSDDPQTAVRWPSQILTAVRRLSDSHLVHRPSDDRPTAVQTALFEGVSSTTVIRKACARFVGFELRAVCRVCRRTAGRTSGRTPGRTPKPGGPKSIVFNKFLKVLIGFNRF